MIVIQQAPLRAQYDLVEDSYTGQGGFSNGEYIDQYARELDGALRASMASYTNYIRPIVDAQVDPVFSGKVQRETGGDDILDAFVEDADNNGTSLQDMIHHATTETVLLGNSFLVMDNFPEKEIPATVSQVIEERKFPFLYTKKVQDVYSFETDMFGKLIDIVFFFGMYTPDGQDEQTYLYKRFSREEIEFFTMEDEDTDEPKKNTISLTSHDLGVVPVVFYDKEVLPFSPYYSMATLARKIYNTDSAIDDLSRSQMFSILVLPNSYTGNESKDAVVISNHNALFVDSLATVTPNYISPDSNIMKTNLERQEIQMKTLIQSADVLGTTAIATGNTASSGIAESYKFFGKQQALNKSATIATKLEMEVIKMFGLFMDATYDDYSVDYPNNFSPTFNETKLQIEVLERVADRDISDLVTANLNADIVKLIAEFMEWEDEQLGDALDSIPEVSEIV